MAPHRLTPKTHCQSARVLSQTVVPAETLALLNTILWLFRSSSSLSLMVGCALWEGSMASPVQGMFLHVMALILKRVLCGKIKGKSTWKERDQLWVIASHEQPRTCRWMRSKNV